MNFDKNCNNIIEDYLLGKSELYQSRGPLSLLITIVVLGCTNYYSLSKNSYVNQLILPITTFILSMIIISIVARLLISRADRTTLKQKCKLWINDPNTSTHPESLRDNELITINLDKVSEYDGKIDGWTMINGREQVKERFELKDSNMPQVNSNFTVPDRNPEQNMDNTVRPQDNLINGHQIYSHTPMGADFSRPLKPATNIPSEDCLLGNGCGVLCSGTGVNNCNVVAPVPGPQWQPQSAKTVQRRLNNGQYVPRVCPQN